MPSLPRLHAAAASAATAVTLMLLASCPAAVRACSSFVVNCEPDGAVVTVRTMDFDADLISYSNVTLFPKVVPLTGMAVAEGLEAPVWNISHTFLAATLGATLGLDGPPIIWDGLNDAGLAVGWLWQSNISFHAKYDPAGPAEAITIPDLAYYLLGSFSTVEEVRAYLNPDNLQITTQIIPTKVRELLTTVFTSDPDQHTPDADGTIWVGLHLHVTDAAGDGLLLEGTPDGGFAVYDTPVLTNEPSFPDMQKWLAAYTGYDFSSVPGIANAPSVPFVKPEVIPFNSASDAKYEGYFGSQSRFLRLSLQSVNCSEWAWPNATWSPGYVNDGTSALALKRAQNWLGSVLVPAGVLGQSRPGTSMYATQMSILKDQTYPAYYYNSPINNGWMKIDLAALSDAREGTWFPIISAAPQVPFATDVTAGGAVVL